MTSRVPQAIVDVVVNLQFTLVETLWKKFWRFNQTQHSDSPVCVSVQPPDTFCISIISFPSSPLPHCFSIPMFPYLYNDPFLSFSLYRDDEAEKRLPKDSLVLLSKYEPLLKWSRDCDHLLYQGLVETLIPDVLRPIPSECFPVGRKKVKAIQAHQNWAQSSVAKEGLSLYS